MLRLARFLPHLRMTSMLDRFLHHPVFRNTHRARLIPLGEAARVERHAAGDVLFKQFHPADQCYLLGSGAVAHETSGDAGGEAWPLGGVDWPFAALGWSGFLPPHRNGTTARATSDVEVLAWRHDVLAPIFYADPRLSVDFLTLVVDSVRRQLESVRAERIAAQLAGPPRTFARPGALAAKRARGMPLVLPVERRAAQPHRFAPGVIDALRRSAFFEQFDDATLRHLADSAQLVRRDPEQELVRQGQDTAGLLLLAAGAAVAYFTADDADAELLDRFRSIPENGGILAGIPGIDGGWRAEATVISTSTCWFYRIPASAIEQLVADDPEFGRAFMQRHLVRLAQLISTARLPRPCADEDPDVTAIKSLLNQNQTRLPVMSALHKLPHLLNDPLTVGEALASLRTARDQGNYEERAIARACSDRLAGLAAEHRFFRGVLAAYDGVVRDAGHLSAAELRSRCDQGLANAFGHLHTEIHGIKHLPDAPGHIVIINHLSCPEHYRLPNNYHFSFDTAFVSVLLHAFYGVSPIRVVRQSPGADYGHNLFYSRLGHITVTTAESGLPDASPECLERSRRESAEELFERGRIALAHGENVLICPEGRSQKAGDSPARFYSGAFRLAQHAACEPLIVPIALAGFDRRYKDTKLVAVVQQPFHLSARMQRYGTSNLRVFLERYRREFARAVAAADRWRRLPSAPSAQPGVAAEPTG